MFGSSLIREKTNVVKRSILSLPKVVSHVDKWTTLHAQEMIEIRSRLAIMLFTDPRRLSPDEAAQFTKDKKRLAELTKLRQLTQKGQTL